MDEKHVKGECLMLEAMGSRRCLEDVVELCSAHVHMVDCRGRQGRHVQGLRLRSGRRWCAALAVQYSLLVHLRHTTACGLVRLT